MPQPSGFTETEAQKRIATETVLQGESGESKMLTKRAKSGYYQMLQLGSALKFIPFDWDGTKKEFTSPTGNGLDVFRFHEVMAYLYTSSGTFKFIRQMLAKDFPLFQKLTSALWDFAFLITCVGFFQFHIGREEVMRFGNLMLRYIREPLSGPEKNPAQYKNATTVKALDKKDRNFLSIHIYIALFLLYTNSGVHTLITAQSPCTPMYVSASYYKCATVDEVAVSLLEQTPFLFIEFYMITLFLYTCSFFWSFIFMGLGYVAIELRRLKLGMSDDSIDRATFRYSFRKYRELQVLVAVLNQSFLYFLIAFPMILFFILAMLVFGTIRLWHVNPQSNIMFPLCAMRCGFEAVTPLHMAGRVNKSSGKILEKWKLTRNISLDGGATRHASKLVRMIHRSCKRIQCTSGSLYTFENSIVLCSINNCSQLTFNLLVSFEK